ncbi:hypothetical protein [Myroides sp. N17-2]|uniref:hypothetical protein n=1 Tax=Myroides sp. N17-2 TaxID=2030799 RepID=UPI000EFB9651|nr:hypothetical protein [Myroides sp. N17-2]
MIKNIIQFIVLFGTVSIYAQTGIGTVLPDRNAVLDVVSTDKGVLIPRMKLTGEDDITTIPGGDYTEGLIVFNTGATNFEAGFYFWGKGKWNALISNNTLFKYIEEKADPNSVQIIKKGDDFTFIWKEAGVEKRKDISELVKDFETLTTLTPEEIEIYVYLEQNAQTGEMMEVHVDKIKEIDPNNPVIPSLLRTYKAKKFVYKNEQSQLVDIKGSDLFGGIGSDGGKVGLETITSLKLEDNYKENGKALVYTDENKDATPIYISDIFNDSETLTALKADSTKKELIYTDELKNPTVIAFSQITQEPWYVAKSTEQATKNDQDIYINGWVGIGYDEKSDLTKVPNEKLRVKGSITATNSYYADYVFDSYFEGSSSLKYDYKFNDLKTVDYFIRTNRHLPGITPISDLEKTSEGYSFNMSELSIQLLEKTEELFLHIIDQQKELDAKELRIDKLESEMSEMRKHFKALETLLAK